VVNPKQQEVAASAADSEQQHDQQQQGQQQQDSPQPLRLSLQLLAPLLPEHCMLLLQLQGLAGLSIYKTSAWLDCQSLEAQQGRSARYKVPAAGAAGAAAAAADGQDDNHVGAAAAGAAGGGAGHGAGFFPPQYRPLASSFDSPAPVLPTSMLRALRGLPQLDSLAGTVGRPMLHNENPGEVSWLLELFREQWL
jgi:hypothetical protein